MKEMAKIPFLALSALCFALPKLNTTCIADFRKVNDLLTKAEELFNPELKELFSEFIKRHGLPESEVIDVRHPLYNDWLNVQQEQQIAVEECVLQAFTESELDCFMKNRDFSFFEKKVLVEYTLKA